MPLPALLLERLKRRKIIQVHDNEGECEGSPGVGQAAVGTSSSTLDKKRPPSIGTAEQLGPEQELEEIIAENYSDDEDEEARTGEHQEESQEAKSGDNEEITDQDASHSKRLQAESHEEIGESILGCPNKYNIYHNCSQYCVDHYAQPEEMSPTMDQRKQLALILKTYPLSNDWTVVYDPGVKTFYFWNIITNLVSWLPPGMNGFISIPADQIRKSIREMVTSDQQQL